MGKVVPSVPVCGGRTPVTTQPLERGRCGHLLPTKFRRTVSKVVCILAALGLVAGRVASAGHTPNLRDRIDSVYVKGDSSYVIVHDKVFDERNLQKLTHSILSGYYERGHYWASVKVDRIRTHDSRVELELRIIKGPLVRLSGTAFSGLTRTNHDLMARYLPVGAGDTLTDAALRRAETAASRIGFVTFHPPPVVRPLEGYTRADLEFLFSEKNQFTFEGGGGYLPDNSTGLVWHLNLNFSNLFGRGREASIISERREKGRNLLRLGYGQPLFVAGVGHLRVDVATRDYRQQFYEFSLEGTYVARLSSSLSTGLSLGWKSVEPVGDLPSYSRFASRFSIKREALDDRINPVNGLILHWSIAYSYRRYSEDSLALRPERTSFNETRASASIEWYKRVIGRLIGRLGLNYVGLETDESLPPISELIFVGGPGSLRGFRNDQFAVLRTAFGSLEPRLRFSNGYLFTFYDAAYLNNRTARPDGTVKTEELYRYGYGLGIALHDNRRAIKLSLGWNPELQFDQPRLSVEFSSDI